MSLVTPPDISIIATLGTVSGVPRSTASGMTGKLRFEIAVGDAEELVELVGQEAFDITFDGAQIGEGYSISGLGIRPDANGDSRAFVNLIAPETTAPKLALLFANNLIGKSGHLVLTRRQTTINDQLTRRATDPEPCPYPACQLQADHPGDHVLEDDLLPVN